MQGLLPSVLALPITAGYLPYRCEWAITLG
jgi:hypothetical protein